MIDTSRRRLPYVVIDVFTDRPLEGNSLAIFTDARGLSTEQMQALAREMNLAESTFILPREIEEERRSGTRVRIFTVQEELPFAGHPTLGTAYFLHRFGGSNEIWLDLNIGKIAVRLNEHVDCAAPIIHAQRAFEHDREFVEFTCLPGLLPSVGAAHMGDAHGLIL